MGKKKNKRKPRDKDQKTVDLTKPIVGIEKFGTVNDPCFAKLYDPRTDECSRCGDCELCSIALGQMNHKLRQETESTHAYKDLEEAEIQSKDDPIVLRKEIRKRIKEMTKQAKGKDLDMELVVDDIFAAYHKDGFMKPKIRKIIKSTAEKSGVITLYKNKLKWILP